MLRRIALFTMIASFVVLGVIDIHEGRVRIGLAGLLLAVVQALFFL